MTVFPIDQKYATLEAALDDYSYVELDRVGIIVHDPNSSEPGTAPSSLLESPECYLHG